MSLSEHCSFVSSTRDHDPCTLERGHAGNHVGKDGGRLLTQEQAEAVRVRMDALSIAELQALMKDPKALQALAEDAAPDRAYQAQVQAISEAATAVVGQRSGDSANRDPVAELRLVMLTLNPGGTELVAVFQARTLVDSRMGPVLARALAKAGQVAERRGLSSKLEPLLKEATEHFAMAVPHWQRLHVEMLGGRSPLARRLPTPPDLFAGVVVGVATVRLAPQAFSSQEKTFLIGPWERMTGDKSPVAMKSTPSETCFLRIVYVMLAIIALTIIGGIVGKMVGAL